MENEFLVSVTLLENLFQKGAHHPAVKVTEGPANDARIIGVEWRPRDHQIAILYDRPVPVPLLSQMSTA